MANGSINSTADWPQEGLPREKAAIRMAGTTLWQTWQQAKAACPPRWRQLASDTPLTEDEQRNLNAVKQTREAFYAPLINATNSGVLVAKGRPKNDPFVYRAIPPPLPTNWETIPDLLFWPKKLAPQDSAFPFKVTELPSRQATAPKQSETPPQTATIRSNKEWFEWAKQNILPDDANAEHGWKKRYAEKLADRMKADATSNKKIKPVPSASIAARLREIGWPENDDETTTK